MKKKRTQTTLEVHQIFVIRRPENSIAVTCNECQGAEMLSPEEASVILGVPPRAIYSWVEAGLIHYTETPEGLLLVCPNSMPVIRQAEISGGPDRGL